MHLQEASKPRHDGLGNSQRRLTSMYLFSFAIFALVIISSLDLSNGAALNTAGKYKSNRDRGCFYMMQHFKNGEQIKTEEPCLNCTCESSMLMCYLRVCPYVKPVGDRCIIEKVPGECCPKIICPEVQSSSGVNIEQDIEPETTEPSITTNASVSQTTSSSNYDNSSVSTTISNVGPANETSSGCVLNGIAYQEGDQMPSDSKKPCEVCYCIKNASACVMQDCALEVGGCKPIYTSGGCCPTRYDCSAGASTPRSQAKASQGSTSFKRFWEYVYANSKSTTSTMSPLSATTTPIPVDKPIVLPDFGRSSAHPGYGCRLGNSTKIYPDGAIVPSKNKCEHCYCMRSEIVCAVQECRPPCDGCVPIIEADDQCCPKRYECFAPTQRVPTDNVVEMHQGDEIGISSAPLSPVSEAMTASTPLPSALASSPAFETHMSSTTPPQVVPSHSDSSLEPKAQEPTIMTTRQTKPPMRPISPKLNTNEEDIPEQDTTAAGKQDPATNVDGFALHGEREQESDPVKSSGKVVAIEGPQNNNIPHNEFESSPSPSDNNAAAKDLGSTPSAPTQQPDANIILKQESEQRAGKQPLAAPSIPGEGSCRYNGRVYLNGQEIRAKDKCMEVCMCINGVVYCDEVDCPRGPENLDQCKRVLEKGDCCPKYICPEEAAPATTPAPIQEASSSVAPIMETTQRLDSDVATKVEMTTQSTSQADTSSSTPELQTSSSPILDSSIQTTMAPEAPNTISVDKAITEPKAQSESVPSTLAPEITTTPVAVIEVSSSTTPASEASSSSESTPPSSSGESTSPSSSTSSTPSGESTSFSSSSEEPATTSSVEVAAKEQEQVSSSSEKSPEAPPMTTTTISPASSNATTSPADEFLAGISNSTLVSTPTTTTTTTTTSTTTEIPTTMSTSPVEVGTKDQELVSSTMAAPTVDLSSSDPGSNEVKQDQSSPTTPQTISEATTQAVLNLSMAETSSPSPGSAATNEQIAPSSPAPFIGNDTSESTSISPEVSSQSKGESSISTTTASYPQEVSKTSDPETNASPQESSSDKIPEPQLMATTISPFVSNVTIPSSSEGSESKTTVTANATDDETGKVVSHSEKPSPEVGGSAESSPESSPIATVGAPSLAPDDSSNQASSDTTTTTTKPQEASPVISNVEIQQSSTASSLTPDNDAASVAKDGPDSNAHPKEIEKSTIDPDQATSSTASSIETSSPIELASSTQGPVVTDFSSTSPALNQEESSTSVPVAETSQRPEPKTEETTQSIDQDVKPSATPESQTSLPSLSDSSTQTSTSPEAPESAPVDRTVTESNIQSEPASSTVASEITTTPVATVEVPGSTTPSEASPQSSSSTTSIADASATTVAAIAPVDPSLSSPGTGPSEINEIRPISMTMTQSVSESTTQAGLNLIKIEATTPIPDSASTNEQSASWNPASTRESDISESTSTSTAPTTTTTNNSDKSEPKEESVLPITSAPTTTTTTTTATQDTASENKSIDESTAAPQEQSSSSSERTSEVHSMTTTSSPSSSSENTLSKEDDFKSTTIANDSSASTGLPVDPVPTKIEDNSEKPIATTDAQLPSTDGNVTQAPVEATSKLPIEISSETPAVNNSETFDTGMNKVDVASSPAPDSAPASSTVGPDAVPRSEEMAKSSMSQDQQPSSANGAIETSTPIEASSPSPTTLVPETSSVTPAPIQEASSSVAPIMETTQRLDSDVATKVEMTTQSTSQADTSSSTPELQTSSSPILDSSIQTTMAPEAPNTISVDKAITEPKAQSESVPSTLAPEITTTPVAVIEVSSSTTPASEASTSSESTSSTSSTSSGESTSPSSSVESTSFSSSSEEPATTSSFEVAAKEQEQVSSSSEKSPEAPPMTTTTILPASSNATTSPADEFLAGISTTSSFKPVELQTTISSIRGSPTTITIPWSEISNSTLVSTPSTTTTTTTTSTTTEIPTTVSSTNTTQLDRRPTNETTTSSSEPDYEEISEETGCEYEGKTYNSAQQIPRSHPCDFCFCFRGDIICLQQTCPPPVPHCFETVMDGFCCPRYECPVHTVRSSTNSTSLSLTPFESTNSKLSSQQSSARSNSRGAVKGCFVENKLYGVGQRIDGASGPCLDCICDTSGMMKCNPKECTPEDPLLQQINNEVIQSALSRGSQAR